MTCCALVLLALALAAPARAGEFPSGLFPPATALEREYRQARDAEGRDPRGAIAAYKRLLRERKFPAPDALRWSLARLLPPRQAEEHWKAVLDSQPESPFEPEALEGLANLSLTSGRPRDAALWLRRLAAEAGGEPARVRALGRLLPVLDLSGEWTELEAVARTLWVELPEYPEARTAGAYLTALSGDPLARLLPAEALARGKRLFERGSREEAAVALRELRDRLGPGDVLRAEASLLLGKALFHLRRHGEALEALEEARTEPRLGEEAAYYGARALFGLDRGGEGARRLVRLARANPRGARARDYLGQASRVFEGRGERLAARRAQALLLRRAPRSPEAREMRWRQGWEAYREGRYTEAAARFWAARQGAGRDYPRAQSYYWEGRALAALGDGGGALRAHDTLEREFPLGYYAGLVQGFRATGRGDLDLEDPRRAGKRPLPAPEPRPGDLGPGGRADDGPRRAEAYLRLGLPEAARRVLGAWPPEDRRARLLYWSEDFHGALRASGRTWVDWTPDSAPEPLDSLGLSYPLAYPRSASEAAREAGIHPHFLLAVAHTESHFSPRTYSSAEARGLMQFIPATGAATAKAVGLKSFEVDDLYDPRIALRLGAHHLRELLDRFEGDVALAAAAYNAGARAVERWKAERGDLEGADFVEAIPYRETRRYVKKVLTALDAYGRLDPPGLWPRHGDEPAPEIRAGGTPAAGPNGADPVP